MDSLPRRDLSESLTTGVLLSLSLLVLAGCGLTVNDPASFRPTGTTAALDSGLSIEGHVGGEQWGVSNATIQLYSLGTKGIASAASPLLTQPVLTDTSGNFRITEAYSCPSPTSQLYLVASGGNPGLEAGTDNQAIALMTMLGPCNGLSSSISYPINEVTTVGSVWPLGPYMTSATQLGSNLNDPSLTAALTLVNQLINLQQAISPGVGVPPGWAVQTAKLYTIANDFHTCVLSAGGEAGDGSACGLLFSLATPPGGVAPKNIIEAALRLAQANQLNPEGLFQLVPANAIYLPVLPTSPTSWDLGLIAIPAPPSFSPPGGGYSLGQQIVLSTTAPGAAIHYTTDGSQPSLYSAVYEGPLVLSSTETVRAISMVEEISSPIAAAAFSPTAKRNLEVTPSQVSLSPSESQLFTVSESGPPNSSVSWSISPAVGTISAAGLYTAPASITSAQTITITATSSANPAQSAQAVVSLNPPAAVGITIGPASVSLSSSQTQQFTATVTGTSNTKVTWSLSPAVGTISAAGLYTAPASITNGQTVTVTATSSANPSVAASAYVSTVASTSTSTSASASTGKSYYLATAAAGGKDSNSGLSPTAPWLTPNHPLNCGDVITAAASTSYSSSNFRSGNWGTVSCPAGNNVAWLRCAQFGACKIIASGGQPGLYVDKSYWGVEGWEITAANSTSSFCFGAAPNYLTPVVIHHIIFANNIANGCQQGGFTTFNSGKTASVDYISIIGNIAYNAAQNGANCFSGISIYQPMQSDSLPGTHIYVAGNFSYGNFDPSTCGGTAPTDGEGITLDTFDNSQGGGAAYLQQAAVENNILIGNGGRGITIDNNNISGGAPIYVEHNTAYGNNRSTTGEYCAGQGEIAVTAAFKVIAEDNLTMTSEADGCSRDAIYAFSMSTGNNTDVVQSNWLYSAAGNTKFLSDSGTFAYGTNATGTSPSFASTTIPSAPSCSGASSAVACMASVVTDFTPRASGAAAYGYQAPKSQPITDALFPKWLCNVNLPSGLISTPCTAAAQ